MGLAESLFGSHGAWWWGRIQEVGGGRQRENSAKACSDVMLRDPGKSQGPVAGFGVRPKLRMAAVGVSVTQGWTSPLQRQESGQRLACGLIPLDVHASSPGGSWNRPGETHTSSMQVWVRSEEAPSYPRGALLLPPPITVLAGSNPLTTGRRVRAPILILEILAMHQSHVSNFVLVSLNWFLHLGAPSLGSSCLCRPVQKHDPVEQPHCVLWALGLYYVMGQPDLPPPPQPAPLLPPTQDKQ